MVFKTITYKSKKIFDLSAEIKRELLSDDFSVGSSYNWSLSNKQKKRFLELFQINEMDDEEIEILKETIFMFYFFEAKETLPEPSPYNVSDEMYEAMSYEDRDWLDERDSKAADYNQRYRLLNEYINEIANKRKRA